MTLADDCYECIYEAFITSAPAPPSAAEDERERFGAWLLTVDNEDFQPHSAWMAWQERASKPSPPSPTLERVREALEASRIAIDDWLHTFAPDECGDFYVEQTSTRIMDAGGTPAYIAQVQQKNRTALALLEQARE